MQLLVPYGVYFFFNDNDDDYYYNGYSLEFSCLTYNFLLFLVFTHLLYINLGTAVRSPEDMFFKVDSAGKDITFLKSMGRQHLPLSGP